MTLAPLLLVSGLGGVLALGAARWRRLGLAGQLVGPAALLVALLTALALPAVEPPREGAALSPLAAALHTTPYIRLVAILWCFTGLMLSLLAVLTARIAGLAGATLVGLTAGIVALAASDLLIATLAAVVAGVAGLLVTAPDGAADDAGGAAVGAATAPEAEDAPASRLAPPRPVPAMPIRVRRASRALTAPAAVAGVAARELRTVVLAGVAVLSGVTIVAAAAATPTGSQGAAAGLTQAAPLVGLASLAIALGVALRTGAIPFHLWAARVADVAPGAALPLLLAWTPLVLAAVAVAAWDTRVASLSLGLEAERAVIVAIGVLTLGAGSLASLVQDDLEHVVGYLVIADGGLVLLALAGADPATVAPSLAWLVIVAVSKSALAAWAVAMTARFRSRRLPDLSGWARRAPVLAVALVLTGVATVGLPGWLAWGIRQTLPRLAAGEGAGLLLWLVALLVVVPYARILGAGLDRPSATVTAAPSERPTTAVRPRADDRPRRAAATGMAVTLRATIRADRPLVVSALVLVLALGGVTVAAGGLGLADAASVPPPAIGAGGALE